MTTLAQRIVESRWSPGFRRGDPQWAKHGRNTLAITQVALDPPTKGREVAVAVVDRATRFVFTEDAPGAVYAFMEQGQIPGNHPFVVAHLPAPCVWLEWFHDDAVDEDGSRMQMQIGVMMTDMVPDWFVKKHGGGRVMMTIFAAERDRGDVAPYAAVSIPSLPTPDPNGCPADVHWCGDPGPHFSEQIKSIIHEALCVLFLINTPRVCEIVEVTHPDKVQRRRAKAGRHPLIEYKRLTLKIGDGGKRYHRDGQASGDGPGEGRRLHQVIGHFRTYAREQEKLVAWVPPHWRGDASRGVVIHDRDVKR